MDWKSELLALDGLVDHGSLAAARRVLRELTRLGGRRIPRRYLEDLSGIARRAGLPDLAVSVLRPVVRPERSGKPGSTASECSEYAAALIQSGAVREGLALIARIDRKEAPSSYLYEAFGHYARWDYPKAVAALESWRHAGPDHPFRRLAYHLHMGTACTHVPGRLEEAGRHLKTVLEGSSPTEFRYLHEKACARLIEVRFYEGRHDEALELGARLRKTSEYRDYSERDEAHLVLFESLCRLARNPCPSANDRRRLRCARERVWASGDMLHAREGDVAEALVTGSRELLLHGWFGTRSAVLKARLLKRLEPTGPPPAQWIWNPSRKTVSAVLDSRTGGFSANDEGLPRGMQLQRLIAALSSDFYLFNRPAELLELLSPDEHYHPIHSRNRVQQLVFRFREWAERTRAPVELRESQGGYRLHPADGVGIRVYPQVFGESAGTVPARIQSEVERLRELFGSRSFGAREASRAIGSDQRTVTRLLTPALEAGLVLKDGQGRATRYRLREL